MATKDKRPLRADAERNRRRLLDAANELFATKGLAVGLDEIARQAGVGVGTAYRRFRDKREVIEALFEERLGDMVKLAEDAIANEDPWAGLTAFMEQAVELQIANRGLKEITFGSEYGSALVKRANARLAPLTEELVRRAQKSGALRRDVVESDLALLQYAVSSVGELLAPYEPELWRRYLTVVMDGLRTSNPDPLEQPPLSPKEFATAMRKGRARPA